MQKVRPGMQVKVERKSSPEAAATPPAAQPEKAPASPGGKKGGG
jgi:hypothetical protein